MSIENNLKRIADALEALVSQGSPAVDAKRQKPEPVVTVTADGLNASLQAECKRLAGREPIDTIMRAAPFNAQSIKDIAPEQYGALIAAVQAVQA